MDCYLVLIRKIAGGYLASSPDFPGDDVFGPTLWEADRRFEAARAGQRRPRPAASAV